MDIGIVYRFNCSISYFFCTYLWLCFLEQLMKK
uniref:Uncharacterized protein n=1 Tax=Anguilla anguilla TaxID=7936 RepID=A0A0E9Q7V2_ANGAN